MRDTFVILMTNYALGPFGTKAAAVAYRDKYCSKARKWRIVPYVAMR